MHSERKSLRDVSDLDVQTAIRVLETMVFQPVYRGVPEGVTPDEYLRILDAKAAQYDILLRLKAEANRRTERGIPV